MKVRVTSGYYRGMEGVAQAKMFAGFLPYYDVLATNTSPMDITRFWREGVIYKINEDMMEFV